MNWRCRNGCCHVRRVLEPRPHLELSGEWMTIKQMAARFGIAEPTIVDRMDRRTCLRQPKQVRTYDVTTSYTCESGCCHVRVKDAGSNLVRIHWNRRVFSSYAALGREVGMSTDGAKNRLKRHVCLAKSKRECYVEALEKRGAKREVKPLPNHADPLCNDFLRLMGASG